MAIDRVRVAALSLGFAALAGCRSPSTSSSDEVGESGDGDGDGDGDGESESEGETGDPEPEPITLDWDEVEFSLSLLRGEEVLIEFPADGFALGEVDAIDDSSSYDPLFVQPDAWRSVIDAQTIEDTPTRVEVVLVYEGGGQALLVVEEQAEGSFACEWTPEPGPVVAMFRLAPIVDESEGFYGLGEYFDAAEHRGRVRALQLEYDPVLDGATNEAHVPVPFLLGTRGWGLYVDDDHAATFDVAASADDRVVAEFGNGPDAALGLRFHLFAAEHPLDVTKQYWDVTGAPRRPAAWALGPWIWRDENLDQAEVEQDIATIRELDLATSAIWVDRPYATAVNSFDFELARFPDAQAMIDSAHAAGLRFALWHTPYLDPDDPALTELRSEAELGGYFPLDTALLTSDWGEPIDFTNQAALEFWRENLQAYADMGVEGYKLDYAEDVTVGLNGIRTVWAFADGSSERTMHKAYSRLYHQAYSALLPREGGFLLARAGSHRDQMNVDVIWPGDLDATMTRHGEDTGEYVSVGGLPAAVVAGMSLGPSGFPLFASDTGGYRHSPPDPETFRRWFEHTAFTPVMQVGTSSNDVPWQFEQDVLDDYRELARLHMRLFPYLWTHVSLAERPIVRALGLAFPELGVHPEFDYMLGAALLCAPVVEPGASEREIGFPPGLWIHWFTGEVVDTRGAQGASSVTVPAPFGTPAVFLRAGELVPMLRETVDSLAPTTMPGIGAGEVDSFATTAGLLVVRTSAGPASSFELFDQTMLTQATLGSTMSLSIAPGTSFEFGARFEILALETPPSAVSDGEGAMPELDPAAIASAARGWAWEPDELGGLLLVAVEAGSQTVQVELAE